MDERDSYCFDYVFRYSNDYFSQNSVMMHIPWHIPVPCRPTYVEEVLGFTYTDAPICLSYSCYGDLGKLNLVCVFNVVVDTFTIWKVCKVRSAQGNTKFQKKEIDFLKQSFSQAIYLMIAIPLWFILPMYSNSVLTQFLLGLLFRPIIHSFDGVLTLYCNVDIRKSLARKFKRQTNSAHNSVLVGGKSSTRVALAGAICNGLIVIAVSTNKSLNHSFSMLTGNQALFNSFCSLTFLLYMAPMLILDSEFLKSNSQHAGFFLLLAYDVSIQTHALITINRFCAVFFPMTYKNIFSCKLTKVVMMLSFSISLVQVSIFFQFLGCKFVYNDTKISFLYSDLQICTDYFYIFDLGKIMTLCTFNVVVDCITIWKVRKIRSAQGSSKFQKKEIDFLKQSFGQAMYLFTFIPVFMIAPFFVSSKAILFILGTLAWSNTQFIDGVLALYFNIEIRKCLSNQYITQSSNVNSSVFMVGGKSSTRIQ
ncbi:Protein CBG19086 [Caenorhabditis briggsae]|uniref:Protein CBG19086 n=1 Tax=Caenorhabditis briggsae TaxID=6238 RepID=A8XUR5_CAEBR|nr:Protein CBG19086 [Caenorhabditis briggsae]CAP36390.2 Protein CBG19086 [Caenorhabditis briggsae]